MISPEGFIFEHEHDSYEQLIEERNELFESIVEFETAIKNKEELAGFVSPSPEVMYQIHLSYLSKLCDFMHEKYNEEYVWGDKKLFED